MRKKLFPTIEELNKHITSLAMVVFRECSNCLFLTHPKDGATWTAVLDGSTWILSRNRKHLK